MRLRVPPLALPLAIAAVTVAAFWPVLDNGFVDWGDEREIVGNADVLGFSAANLKWMFTTIQMGHYQPITWSSFAVDHQLWDLNPAGYHLTSLILHAACAVAAYLLIRRFMRAAWAFTESSTQARRLCYWSEPATMICAAAGALLFALHPLRVESVAWASERRGLLSALFFMMAVIYYMRYAGAVRGSVPLPEAPAEGSAGDAGSPDLQFKGQSTIAPPSAFASGGGTGSSHGQAQSGLPMAPGTVRGAVPLPEAPAEGSSDDAGPRLLRRFRNHATAASPSAGASGDGTGTTHGQAQSGLPMAPDRRRFFWLAVAMFALSLLAKELSLTLPAVLLALDAYPLGRLRATPRQAMGRMVLSLVIEKWPFLALSAAWMIIAALGAAQSGVARSLAEYGLPQRAAQALYGLAFYPAKTILPIGLSNLYSIPPAMNPLEVRFIISAAAAIAITIALVLLRRRLPAGLTAWTCFAILVLPVLGLVQTGHQLVADRYSYLPAVALSAVVSGLLLRAWQKCGGGGAGLGGRAMLVATSLAVLIAAAALARDQIRVWRDSQSLWTHAVEVDPDCPIAHNNLGAVLARQGESQEAIEQFRRAIELDGDYAAAHRNLREMLSQAGTD